MCLLEPKKLRIVLLLSVLAAFVGSTSAGEGEDHMDWKKSGNARATKLEQCVEDTDVMRRNHMKFLLHQRDETMHEGIRTEKHSLINCISCHANKDARDKYIPVNAEGQFCSSCHAFAGVNMDCFQCHATKPRDRAEVRPMIDPGLNQTARGSSQPLVQHDLASDSKTLNMYLFPGR